MRYFSIKRLWHELITSSEFKSDEYIRGFDEGKFGFWPEENATYWYMDGYTKGEKE